METEWACYRRRPPAEKKHGPDTEIETVWSERRQLREKWKLNMAPVRIGESGKNKAPGLQFHSTLN